MYKFLNMYYIIFIGKPVPTKRNRGPIVTVGNRCDRPNRLSTNQRHHMIANMQGT